MAYLRAADASGQHEEEGWRVRKDVTQFWASAVVTPVRDLSAQLLGFVNVIHDLTEQKALADAVREGEERIRGFLDHSPNWMFIKDLEGRYLLVNKVFAEMHGLTEPEIIGKSDFELFPPGHAARFWSYDSRVLDTGEIVDYELTPQTSVMPRYSVDRKFPLRDRHGRIYAVGGVATDITERRLAAETLQTSEERARLIVDVVLVAVITIDANGAITSWNRQAEHVFGWASADVVGRPISEIVIPEGERQAHLRDPDHFLRTGEGPILNKRIELTALHRDGHEFSVEIAIAPIRLRHGWTFSAFVRDLTEAKEREKRLCARRKPS
jgi:PAS domain S-box-containing protein